MAGTDIRYDKYIDSGTWRCEESPTNAHYWVDRHHVSEQGYGIFTCVFCHKRRRFFHRLNGRGEKE